ncbi:hypothetical protein AB3662_17335 [Sorangium cellulosum]|uniref:hypothetical protein n=1 Tax=Sorangium cellulosum TaxID=56 RepID=UPI003D9A87D0
MALEIHFDIFTYGKRLPDEVPIFDVVTPGWTEEEVRALARDFGIDGKPEPRGHRFVVGGGAAGTLEVFIASHSLRWSRPAARSAEDLTPFTLSDPETICVADKFLNDHQVWARNAAHVHHTPVGVFAARVERGAPPPAMHICVSKQVNYTLSAEHEAMEYRVGGPGSKMQVTVGADGEVQEVYRFSRKLAFREFKPRKTIEKSIEKAIEQFAAKGLAGVSALFIDMEYHAEPPREMQALVAPFYKATGTRHGLVGPETEFLARIPALG